MTIGWGVEVYLRWVASDGSISLTLHRVCDVGGFEKAMKEEARGCGASAELVSRERFETESGMRVIRDESRY